MKECSSYCKHGGICRREEGHTGLHDSKFCTWDDAESLTKEQADEILKKVMEERGDGALFPIFQKLT